MAPGTKSAGITPFFKSMAFKNEKKSIEAGRPIFEDHEMIEIRFAGSKDTFVARAHEYSHWEVDEETGEQAHLTYAERWPRQYQQFLAKQQQTKSGTPLDYVPFLTDARRSELRAHNIYTIEALAEIDGQPLKNLGIGGREMKVKAQEYLASTSHDGVILRQQATIDALMSQIQLLQSDRQLASQHVGMLPPREPDKPVPPEPEGEDEEDTTDEEEDDGKGEDERTVAPSASTPPELIGLNRDELKAFIIERTGKRPVGNPSMRNLVRIAQELRG
jgi:hypothetical protein